MRTVNKVTLMERTCIRYGLMTAAALIAFLLLMRLVGLAENVELRFLNLVILITGIVMAYRRLKKEWPGGRLEYVSGLGCGAFTSLVAVTTFAVFIFFYLMFLDPGLMSILKVEHGRFLNPYTSALAVFFEGAFSGMIVSFCLMQYLKDSILPYVREERTAQPANLGVPQG